MRLPRITLFPDSGYMHKGAVQEMFNAADQTVANGGTITAKNLRGNVLFQDASAGSVTMSLDTAANIAAAFPEMKVGEGFEFYVRSNHASNTSTIGNGGDSNITVIGTATVTLGVAGCFLLRKTGGGQAAGGAATFDLIRIS